MIFFKKKANIILRLIGDAKTGIAQVTLEINKVNEIMNVIDHGHFAERDQILA